MAWFREVFTVACGSVRRFIGRRNLKERLIILTILVVLIPVILTNYINLVYSKNVIEDESVVLVKSMVEQVSQSIDEMLKGQIYNISSMMMYDEDLYRLLAVEKYDGTREGKKKKAIDEVLLSERISTQYLSPFENVKIGAIYGKNRELFNISFVPSDTGLILKKVQEIEKQSKEKNLIVQWFPLQDNYFTRVLSDNARERYVEIASRALFRPDTGEYVGTVIFTLYEKAIFQKYSGVKLGNTGELFVIDGKGKLISHQNGNILVGTDINRDFFESIIKTGNNVFTTIDNNRKVLVISKASSLNGWITVGIVPVAEITNKMNKIFSVIVLIVILSLAISIACILLIANGIVNPIRQIIRSMEEVEKGNLNVKVNIKGEYEISNLGRYFNSMLGEINRLIQEEYELERKKKESELNVLMAQINPHFLYNTLESIVWKARSVGALEISEMAASLGRLFRIAVNKGNIIVPVREEIEHVKAYINILKIRYGSKLNFTLNLPDEKVLDYHMLKLVLQPIVENALSYGIEPRKTGGTVSLSVYEHEGKLKFEVQDDGVGISGEKLRELELFLHSREESKDGAENKANGFNPKGIGLKNTHERIRLYFGEEYGVSIRSELQKGTVVSIILPILN